ncbi:hypothetical protein GQX73_g4967 [Xylaria multiplex]|uniref:Uncharacterized protein n=1 Tax=Xylaria multiplex TaxID=323545 RepID=A0A7C8INZ3_9PEZI|nr:hypothetical protein GQX73_g4967 [Xylaria multiplex]
MDAFTANRQSSGPLGLEDISANWTEITDSLELGGETRLKVLGKGFSIICRESKIVEGDIVAWVTTFIEIHSPRLRGILDEVFNGYPSWYLNGSPYAVATPFKPYVHQWDCILDAIRRNGNIKELRLLQRELKPRIEVQLHTLNEARKKGVISFEDLWVILNPGCLMILNARGDNRAAKLLEAHLIPETESQAAHYNLKLAYIDWNGETCGFKVISKVICNYEGLKQVALLPTYPAKFHPERKETSQRLIARGRKFESLRGYHVRNYNGKMYALKKFPTSGDLVETEKPDAKDIHMLSIATVLTSVLHLGEFDVESLEDIEWDDTLYDDLVLPGCKKELMLAIVNRLRSGELSFDDFNTKTGENPWAGINILLSGSPGLEKALTAEAVAEKSRVPLYTLSSRHLGTEPTMVEKSVTNAFKCCQLWGALLLIDQADTFLEARNKNSPELNGIVYRFFYTLRHYRGLTFLLSTRNSQINNIFKGMADLTLPHFEPGQSERRKFWLKYIQKHSPGPAGISHADFDQLSKLPISGKEIPKYIKMALVLVKKDRPLSIEHLKLVLNMDKDTEIADEGEEDKTGKYWFIFVLALLVLFGLAFP